jgi:U3 small nucleolar RNA-associated protein 22
MAPPAIKRRKLEHSESEAESEGSFADFDETNSAVESDEGDAENGQDESDDVSMGSAQETDDNDDDLDQDDDMSKSEKENFIAKESVQESNKQTVDGKATSAPKPPKRPAPSLQDGVYTAESFKSNMFKLQVDELLDQVKLKYGKKEAPAENAMRTLKTIIEQIPSRDALPVSQEQHLYHQRILIYYRSSRLKGRSNQLVLQFPSPAPAHRKTPYTSCSTNDLRV